jgi:WD40 repeat protein
MWQSQISIDLLGQILVDILPGLQLLHQQGQLHGDITPAHLSWDAESQLYRLAPNTSSCAHPIYSAPEQLAGKPVAASDLYSLGVTCIHLLTGVHPFDLFDLSEHRWVWRDYWLSIPTDRQGEQIANILDRLIQTDIQQRWPSAAAVLSALAKFAKLPVVNPPSLWQCTNTLLGHRGVFAGVTSLALNSSYMATASEDKTVRLWSLATHQTSQILVGHQGFVEAVAFQPGHDQILVTGSRDRTIKIWANDQVLQTLNDHTEPINTVAFSPDGQRLASGSSDRTVKLWEVSTGQLLNTFAGHKLKVTAVAFSTVGILASASADSSICLWTDILRHQLTGHVGSVTAIAFSPDGRLLASGGEDRSIRICDTNSGDCVQILAGHPWLVSSLAFAPSGAVLFSGSWDRTIKVWQLSTGGVLDTLTGHTDSVTCLAISADGHQLFSGSRDRSIKIWQPT